MNGTFIPANDIEEKPGTGLGVSINPTGDAGIDMTPEMLEQLRQGQ